jgi:hypothetical protein
LLSCSARAAQGRAWPCLLLGHGELDPFADEGERKRLLLERYQAEVRHFCASACGCAPCGDRVHAVRPADARLRLQWR